MEWRRLGQFLDIAIRLPSHQIHIFPGCTRDRNVVHLYHTEIYG